MTSRESLIECLAQVMAPGENIGYTELLVRLKKAGIDTAGIGVKLEPLAYKGWSGQWRGCEFVTYRVPYFDREAEGDWADGELRIVRRAFPE